MCSLFLSKDNSFKIHPDMYANMDDANLAAFHARFEDNYMSLARDKVWNACQGEYEARLDPSLGLISYLVKVYRRHTGPSACIHFRQAHGQEPHPWAGHVKTGTHRTARHGAPTRGPRSLGTSELPCGVDLESRPHGCCSLLVSFDFYLPYDKLSHLWHSHPPKTIMPPT